MEREEKGRRGSTKAKAETCCSRQEASSSEPGASV